MIEHNASPPHGRLYWYRCHNCGWEAWTSEGVPATCGNVPVYCRAPEIHCHSNADGELPRTLSIPSHAPK